MMNRWSVLCLALLLALPAQSAETVFVTRRLEIEASVDKGLAWLASRQAENGQFVGSEHGETTGIVGLCGMAFLATGDTPGRGRWGKQILACIEYILGSQQLVKGKPEYGMYARNVGGEKMYSHNIATLFMSEVSGMVEPDLQKRIELAQSRAVALIIRAQNVPKAEDFAGGWHYLPDQATSDLSVSGWALMALKSAKLNGAEIPEDNIKKAVKYLGRRSDPQTGKYGYMDAGNTRPDSLTGAGILCMELTGHHGDPLTKKSGDWVLQNHKNFPGGEFPFYGLYYNAQAMFQLGGEYWETFAEHMYSTYLPKQQPDGHWDGRDGTHFTTAMAILAFTVPYRQLPIYQRDETVGQ